MGSVRLVIVRPGLKCAAYEKKGTPSFLLSGIKGLQEGRSIGERKENKPTDVGNGKVGSTRKSVLSRILEEGSANSYGLTKETCLAVYLRNLGKRSGWSRSVSEAVCVLSNDGVWRR